MYYLYLDESGNLDLDTHKAGASQYFVITIMDVRDSKSNRAIEKAVRRTLKHKIHGKSMLQQKHTLELKGSKTALVVKQYFYHQIENIPFRLYTVILDKARFTNQLQLNENRVYNFVTHLVLKEMPLEQAKYQIILTIDKSMGNKAIREFNDLLFRQLESRIPPHVPVMINHNYSHENKLLQAVDFFAWGIYRKYEAGDTDWYEMFREKLIAEIVYPVR